MAQNPYADIFGRLIEYSFQRKMWEQRMAEERKLQEEAFKRHAMQNLGTQLVQAASNLGSIPQNLPNLTAQVPGVKIEQDPEAQQELDKLRQEAIKVGAKLVQGEEQPNAPDILAALQERLKPKFEQNEGKSHIQYGSTRVWLPGNSEEAAAAAGRVQEILAKAEAQNKATAEKIALENQLSGLFNGLPENEELKNSIIGAFKTFKDVSNLYPDPMGRAAAVLTTAQTQIAEIKNGPNKDDPYVRKYLDYLEKQAAAAERVTNLYAKTESAASRKQRDEELAYAAAYELGELLSEIIDPKQINKADYSQFVDYVLKQIYSSPKGRELAKRYGKTTLGMAIYRFLLPSYRVNFQPQTAFGLPFVGANQ